RPCRRLCLQVAWYAMPAMLCGRMAAPSGIRGQAPNRGNHHAMRHLMILLLCMLATAAVAQDGMQMHMGHGPALGASAAFDSHGQLWVVDAADGHIRVRTSTDGGATLGTPTIVNPVPER